MAVFLAPIWHTRCSRLLREPELEQVAMSSDLPIEETNRAVHECLEQCYRSQNRLDCFLSFIARLQSDGWQEQEIDAVEFAVRHILTAVVRSDSGTR